MLETFGQSAGLRVNYAKSCMVPLNLIEQQTKNLATVFCYKIQGMLFTYLGLPMGSTKPRIEHFASLMNKVERQLASISSMLTQAGKLLLINSVLYSLPTYTMCSISVPIAIHKDIDRARRHCMWRKTYYNAKSKAWVAWRKCTRPKKKGRRGLEIINLRSQNVALLLKHLDKFYNGRDILGSI
jgi:hypothetical protein